LHFTEPPDLLSAIIGVKGLVVLLGIRGAFLWPPGFPGDLWVLYLLTGGFPSSSELPDFWEVPPGDFWPPAAPATAARSSDAPHLQC